MVRSLQASEAHLRGGREGVPERAQRRSSSAPCLTTTHASPPLQCLVTNIDADAQYNPPLATKNENSSFPPIKSFPKGSAKPEEYDGAHTEQAFVVFLNEKCGTHCTNGGMLDDTAGRLEALDALAQKFWEGEAAAHQAIFEEVSMLAKELGAGAKHYLRVMEKVVNGSEEYLQKESTR